MVLAGRLHPLLVHFPIGLVLVAAMAELVSTVTNFQQWRAVAVANLRAARHRQQFAPHTSKQPMKTL
jgi:uncharacterized membrane protein